MKTDDSFRMKLCAGTAVLMIALQPLPAQSELVATDDAGGTQAHVSGISSLDFYDNGLFWTVYGGSCSGEFTMQPSFATLGFRNPPIPSEHYLVRDCNQRAVGGAVRDDAFGYYTTPGGVMRKPLGAGPADNSRLIGAFWSDLNPGAMMVYNGRAYYSYSANSPMSGAEGSLGHFAIEYFDLPGAGGLFQPTFRVSHGGGLPNVGRIRKMAVMHYRPLGGGPNDLAPLGIAITEGGYLLRFFVDETIPAFRAAAIIYNGATDFAIRRETLFDPDPFRLTYQEDVLYVSVGTSRCPGDPASRIITLHPVNASTFTVWNSPGLYISAIAVDNVYLFASTHGRRQLGGPFGGCELTTPTEIRSKCYPASVFAGCGPNPDPNWGAIELSIAGENLRSDGQWLYFSRNKELRRIRSNSPAARQDLAALGLEAVQVIQDLNNSVRLVEGKRTIVRAYARVVESSGSQTDWFPDAQLRGTRNGVELGIISPIVNARITREANLANLRPDANRSYQFELPAHWVRSGTLTLRFTVNPALSTSEFIGGADPLANNTTVAGGIAVVQVRPPCFVFASIHSAAAPNYWPWEHPAEFASSMERAKSLLPVPDIHIHPTTERVSDEHFCIRTCGIFPCGFVCNDPFDLTKSEDWDEALEELAVYDNFDQNRPGCSRTHYVGAIHQHPDNVKVAWGGLGERPGTHFLVHMSPGNLNPENTPWSGRTIAHEFGHNLNRMHVNQNTSSRNCGGSTPEEPDPNYPGDTCIFGGLAGTNLALAATPMGFDMLNFKPIRPDNAGDLMSYAPNRWPSIYTYNAMMNALGTTGPAFGAAAAPPPGPYVLVRGILDVVRGTARVKGCYSLQEGIADPAKVKKSLDDAAAQGGHGYTIRKLDAGGAVLEETPLVLRESEDGDEQTSTINQFITKPAAMTALQIVRAGAVLAQCAATANAPVVNAVTAVYDNQGPSLQITIDAADADNDPLRFSIQFSNDDGATWRTLRVNEGSFSFTANPRFLPGGAQCRIRVIASDGFNSAVATSDAFALPGRAPEPFIGGVRDGQRLPFGTTESLIGFALDAEDGSLPPADLSWDLAGPTPKTGTGPSLALSDLSPGIYTATLSTTDAHGNPGTKTLTFEVLALTVAESSVPVVDGEPNDAAYASAPTVSLPLSPQSKARFVHANGNLYVALSDLPYGGLSIRGQVGLYIDVNGSGDSAVQSTDLAFYVDEGGVPAQYEGNGTEMVPRASPSTGFKAVVSRGQSGWNAEFRIADSLLGGWDHAARIGLFDSYSILHFIGGFPIETPRSAWWPSSMGVNDPSTWAPAWFGSAPPAPANLAPIAIAEAPRYHDASGPTKVSLNGSASFDPEGGLLNYSWTQLAGPAVTLENPATATPSFTTEVSSATTFRFQLIVSDGAFDSAPAEVEVVLTPVTPQSVQLPPTATHHEDGSVTVGLGWSGQPGARVIVQASTDLINWEDVETQTVGALPMILFTDAQAGLYPQRFYRLAGAPSETSSSTAGTGLQLDGVNDHVEVLHDDGLNSLPLTITAWIKTSQASGSYPGIVTKYAGGGAQGYAIGLDQGRLSAWYYVDGANYLWDGGAPAGMPFVADGEWHHVAYVVDETGGRVYLDGWLANTHAWVGTAGATAATVPLRFGIYLGGTGQFFNGQLDDVTLWSSALTQEEVRSQMDRPPSGSETGLLGYWRFDEVGLSANDSSPNARHGTLRNNLTRIESTAPIFSSPSLWTGLQFDGVDDHVSVPTDPGLNAFPLTAAVWVKTTDARYTARALVSKYADSAFSGYSLLLSEGRVRAWYFRDNFNYIWDGGLGLDGGFVADGRWHHIALVVDATSGRLYVDGLLRSTLGWLGVGGPTTTTEPLQFARYYNYPEALQGQLDEIALWNRALTEQELNNLIPGRATREPAELIGYWSLDEGPGPLAADSSGSGYNGTLRNGPTRVLSTTPLDANPNAGTAIHFDGVNDVVEVAHHAALNVFPLTATAWVKTLRHTSDYFGVVNKYFGGSGNGYSLHIQNGRAYAWYFNGAGSYVYPGDPGWGGTFVADGRWHHLALVIDESGGRLYVDGVQTATLGWFGAPGACTTTIPLSFGNYPTLVSLPGRMDEVTLWNRALNAGEIGSLMRFGPTGAEAGLTGYWPFDDGADTTATDATGNGRNGTLRNGALWVPSDAPLYP
jgi:hypothetical protein